MRYINQFYLVFLLCFSCAGFADDPGVDAEYWSQKYAIIMATFPNQRIHVYEDIWRGGNNLEKGFMDLLAESYASSKADSKAASKAKAFLFKTLVTS